MARYGTSLTNVTLYSGVPLFSDYKNTRWFETPNEQTTFFGSQKVKKSFVECTYQRTNSTYHFLANANAEMLRDVNYISYVNKDYSLKMFYGFVTHVEYLNEQTSKVYFEIDVLQTFMFDYTFKQSYVNREHQSLYSNGLPVKNTIEENITYGNVMLTKKTKRITSNDLDYHWLIIASKERLHTTERGIQPTNLGVPQPLCYYALPFHRNRGSKVQLRWDYFNGKFGKSEYLALPDDLLYSLYSNTDNVNQIVSLYVTDYFGLPFTSSKVSDLVDNIDIIDDRKNYIIEVAPLGEGANGENINGIWLSDISEFKTLLRPLSTDIFDDFYGEKPKESKLLSAPYSKLIMTTMRGQQIEYNPEEFTNKEVYVAIRGSLGISNKVSYSLTPYSYFANDADELKTLVNLSDGLIDNNPNDVPILVDTLASYIQGNKNSIMNMTNTIAFNGAMNFIGGLGQTTKGAITRDVDNVGTGIANTVSAVGNTQLQLEGLIAKSKDLDNTPPSLQQQGSNTSFDYGNGYIGVLIIFKTVTNEYAGIVSDYFNMYGYKTMRMKMPNLNTRKYFNYIQLEMCNIDTEIEQEYSNKIKSIFINGITLWHTNNICDYSVNNEVK